MLRKTCHQLLMAPMVVGMLWAVCGCVPPADLTAMYAAAIRDAETADPDEINTQLTAIVPYNDDLIWEGDPGASRVLTVTWTNWDGYDALVGGDTVLSREVWVTAAPEVQTFCATHWILPDKLNLRLEQLLGLPPDSGKDRFVELWVDPNDLFRPSPDPEISDHEAGLTLPVSDAFVTVDPNHIAWFDALMASSYGDDGYPWTRLGYTYDWGGCASEVGLSEFVIRSGATVGVRGVTGTWPYCMGE